MSVAMIVGVAGLAFVSWPSTAPSLPTGPQNRPKDIQTTGNSSGDSYPGLLGRYHGGRGKCAPALSGCTPMDSVDNDPVDETQDPFIR